MKTASLVLVGVLMAGYAQTQTINACYNKRTGDLRISNSCKKTEAPISWNVQGAKGDKGDPGIGVRGLQGEPGVPGFTGPNVIDATGQTIGLLINGDSSGSILVYNQDLQKFAQFSGDGQNPSSASLRTALFYFTSHDCSGPGYFKINTDPLFSQSVFYDNGKYFSPLNLQVNTISAGSSNYGSDDKCIQAKSVQVCDRHPCPECNFTPGPLRPWPKECDTCYVWICSDPVKGWGLDPPPANETTEVTVELATIDVEGIESQEVTLPFTEPISLPLSFK